MEDWNMKLGREAPIWGLIHYWINLLLFPSVLVKGNWFVWPGPFSGKGRAFWCWMRQRQPSIRKQIPEFNNQFELISSCSQNSNWPNYSPPQKGIAQFWQLPIDWTQFWIMIAFWWWMRAKWPNLIRQTIYWPILNHCSFNWPYKRAFPWINEWIWLR